MHVYQTKLVFNVWTYQLNAYNLNVIDVMLIASDPNDDAGSLSEGYGVTGLATSIRYKTDRVKQCWIIIIRFNDRTFDEIISNSTQLFFISEAVLTTWRFFLKEIAFFINTFQSQWNYLHILCWLFNATTNTIEKITIIQHEVHWFQLIS